MQVLFARHQVRVYRFVLRLVGNQAAAEDLISEVFLDVWRQADRFEGRSAVSTWLLASARFKALSLMRRKPDEELDEETAGAKRERQDGHGEGVPEEEKSGALTELSAAGAATQRGADSSVFFHAAR